MSLQAKSDRITADRIASDAPTLGPATLGAGPPAQTAPAQTTSRHAPSDQARSGQSTSGHATPAQAISGQAISAQATPRQITRAALAEALLARTPPVVLEALPRKYFEVGHIPTARTLPLDEIDQLVAKLVPDSETPIVVYCANEACRNSHQAADRLVELGYRNVAIYPGGKQDWIDGGLRLEK